MSSAAIRYDVAIAGAGPAGSSAAIRLAKAGLNVVLVEQKRFPREKLCGEFISPECLAHFHDLEIDLASANGVAIAQTVFFTRGGRALTVPADWLGCDRRQALGLSRAEMDKRLLDRAREAGVLVLDETQVKDVIRHDGKIGGLWTRKSSVDTPLPADIVIDARGRSRPFADSPGRSKHAAKYVAFKAHLERARTSEGTCEMFVYKGGYGGCLPVENGLHNLCFIAPAAKVSSLGSDPERFMREVLMTNRRAAETLSDVRVVGDWQAVPIPKLGPRDPVPEHGLLAIGDAAAFIDPFTGSGILLALESGRLAAEVIVGLRPAGLDRVEAEYRERYAQAFNGRLRSSSLLRYAFRTPTLAVTALMVFGSSKRLLRRSAVATRRPTTADT